ncbi:MAG: HAD hydrolase-like protein [Clostridia bacterium]|nr:HAD hydrolase-like protein [Clostridia bacterium]
MTYKNILFDLDGTVTDPYIGITSSILHSLKYYPDIKAPEREALKPFIGPPLYASYMKYFGMDEPTAHGAVEHYREYYSVTGKFENELYEGIKDLLFDLKRRGFKIALATSKPELFARQIIEHFGIADCFDYVLGSTFDAKLIEKGDIIALLCKKAGFETSRSVMVGDTEFDIRGAKENNMASIAVTYGYGELSALKEAQPDFICDTVGALRGILLEG